MRSVEELLDAKRRASERFLAAGVQGRAVGRAPALALAAAVEAAGTGVHAVGVGRKVVAVVAKRTLCIRFYVIQKLDERVLPKSVRLPAELDGCPTDVIEAAPARIYAVPACTTKRKQRQRPMVAGISVAHKDVTAGTIGYFCRSTRPGDDTKRVHILSNNHVLADVNKASVGDQVMQPGPADGGGVADVAARLTRFHNIALGGTTANPVDAAIAALEPGVKHKASICSIGKVVGTVAPTEDLRIAKHGRTTGYREGIVTDISVDSLVGMDHSDPSVVARFTNQFRIERLDPYPDIGLGGDSGSLVVTAGKKPKAVGLYFAGPASGADAIPSQDLRHERKSCEGIATLSPRRGESRGEGCHERSTLARPRLRLSAVRPCEPDRRGAGCARNPARVRSRERPARTCPAGGKCPSPSTRSRSASRSNSSGARGSTPGVCGAAGAR